MNPRPWRALRTLAVSAAAALLLCAVSASGGRTAYADGHADAEAAAVPEVEPEREVVDMSPDDKVSVSMRTVFAPIGSLFRGPSYYYQPRRLEVDTTPSGGLVDLFYVRANFQKRFEQAMAPVTVLLPKRVDTGPRDSLTIRAFREGYRQKSVTVKMSDRTKSVLIDLEPLPNALVALSHRYFAGRSSLGFLTKEMLEFRVQEAPDGFTVVLNETSRSSEAASAMAGMRSPMVQEVVGQQLGEDLLVQVALDVDARESTEVRSRQGHDAARDLYEFTIDIVPTDGGAATVQRAIDALAAIRTGDVTGCALQFDRTLHERLDLGALNRALTPRGDFTDRYVRAAMRRLGEVTPGNTVRFSDGSQYDPTVPIELEAALSQAGGAEGFLALLRTFVGELETETYRSDTLRSLVAPELDSEVFEIRMSEAETAERDCLASL